MQVDLISFLDIPYEVQMETRKWRNSEQIAKYFKIPYITENVHKNWLNSLKQEKPKTVAFLIKKDGINVGVTYFHSIDYDHKFADWGIYIYPSSFCGLGIGTIVLDKCLDFARQNLDLSFLYLDVMKDNLKAVKLYEKFGFIFVGIEENENFLRYQKKL